MRFFRGKGDLSASTAKYSQRRAERTKGFYTVESHGAADRKCPRERHLHLIPIDLSPRISVSVFTFFAILAVFEVKDQPMRAKSFVLAAA